MRRPSSPLITQTELNSLQNGAVHILDCSWYMPQDEKDAATEYERSHIPGAKFFDWDQCKGARSAGSCLYLPEPEVFDAYVSSLGIGDGDLVVLYDCAGFHSISGRAWWMFRVFGHDNVVILDGGFKGWCAAGLAVEQGLSAPVDYVARTSLQYVGDLVRNYDDVLSNLNNGAEQLIDARAYERFTGEGAGPGEMPGHIPGAVSIPFVKCIDGEDSRFRDLSHLKKLQADAGIRLDRPVVAYCGGGGTSPVLALALYFLGKHDVALYDGAWKDWCSYEGSPAETGK